jgi:DNA-3-methyladenine glycosylase
VAARDEVRAAEASAGCPEDVSEPLPVDFYDREVVQVAQDLLGCVLATRDASGIIVETEAYHHTEPACHAYVGLTSRTSTLFGPPGIAYVYRSYGIHALVNAVCEPLEVGAAVLIRALEPLSGLDTMRMRRGLDTERALCSGPGKLTQALGIGLSDNATSLQSGPARIFAPPADLASPQIAVGVRIGITKAAELPWRFGIAGSRYLSRPFPN